MKCSEIHEKIVLSAYGELPDDDSHAMELHLANCNDCREEQQQFEALKLLSAAYPVQEPNANLVARSRARLEESLDVLPPKRWYDRVVDWMTRTATGLQSAPAAACLLLVAGAGLGSIAGYEVAERHAAGAAVNAATQSIQSNTAPNTAPAGDTAVTLTDAASFTPANSANPGNPLLSGEVASVSRIVHHPNSKVVEVSFNQVEPRRIEGTLQNPQIRQLLMLASQNAANPGVRDDSVGLLAAECRSGQGCTGAGPQGAAIRDALMVALRYDRSATVRQKALEGLQPYIGEDMQVRDAVLEALMNDPEARIRSEAITMLEPVEADTSVRQVLSTVALSDQNLNIRNASRTVLRRVSEIQ